MESPWPVPIDTVTASVGGTMLWTHVGRSTLTVVQKATLALSESAMTLLSPENLVIWERLEGDGSLLEDVDLIPHKPRAEVHFVGHAHAPSPTSHLVVRLSVRSEGRVLIDKSVRVIGDRIGGAEPAPFKKMPLGWRRASFDPLRNPIGVEPGSGRAPNLYDPDDVSAAIAFAPVPRSWPMRARFIGAASAAKAGELMGPRIEMQSDISWGYFLGASEDQQATTLRGNEQIYLQHLVDGKPQFSAQLPQLRGVGKFSDGAGFEQALEFKLDTLSIDTDRMRVSCVWRATMPFATTMKPAQCRVVAGVEVGGAAVDLSRKSSGQSWRNQPVAGDPDSAPAATRVFNVDDLDGPPMTQRVDSPSGSHGAHASGAFAPKPRDSSTNVFANQPAPNSFDFEPETSAVDGSGTGTLALTPEAASMLLAKSAAERKQPPPTVAMQLPKWGNSPPAPPPPTDYVPGSTAHMPIFASPLVAPAAGTAPVLVVRASAEYFDDEDSVVGSTMAMSPESAAELLKKPQPTAPPGSVGVRAGRSPTGRTPARTSPPNPPPPAPPPPPPDLERHGTMEMEVVPDSDCGGGTMVLNVNVPGTSRR